MAETLKELLRKAASANLKTPEGRKMAARLSALLKSKIAEDDRNG